MKNFKVPFWNDQIIPQYRKKNIFFSFDLLNMHPNSNHISSSVDVKDGLRFIYGP